MSEPGKMLLPGPSDFDAILVNAIRSADNIFYWTGTKSQGEVASFTCDNWTTSSNGQKGTQGRGYSLAVNWTGRDVTTRECDYSDYHLLCFERG